ncbi:MAG: hypothetical protein AAF674_18065 [Pseudomonadota bacterium]
MSPFQRFLLNVAGILWVIWGLVHAFAGIMVMASDATSGLQAINDAVNPELLVADYHAGVGGVLNQHAWNLLWIGLVTTIGGVLIWRQSWTAIWVTGMIGGLTDLGYFIFVDLPGHANFFPGTVMTLVSGSAILLSGYVWLVKRRKDNAEGAS